MKAYDAGIKFEKFQVATLAGEKNSICVYKQVNVTTEKQRFFAK